MSTEIDDYEELVNCIQCHTKCHSSSCLRKKNNVLSCRYGVPWEFNPTYSLFIDNKGQKTYKHAHNDDRLNIHNADLLSIWRENVDFQTVLSRHAVLTYISKYTAKAEIKSEIYSQILSRLSNNVTLEAPTITVVWKILT